jgi:PHS family inorganic phosphate transporter-like MFS transporter
LVALPKPICVMTAAEKVYTNLHNVAVGNMILAAAGLIPGYWATFLFIDRVGRKPIQLMGFIILTGIFRRYPW